MVSSIDAGPAQQHGHAEPLGLGLASNADAAFLNSVQDVVNN